MQLIPARLVTLKSLIMTQSRAELREPGESEEGPGFRTLGHDDNWRTAFIFTGSEKKKKKKLG